MLKHTVAALGIAAMTRRRNRRPVAAGHGQEPGPVRRHSGRRVQSVRRSSVQSVRAAPEPLRRSQSVRGQSLCRRQPVRHESLCREPLRRKITVRRSAPPDAAAGPTGRGTYLWLFKPGQGASASRH